ncbi:MAG: DUF6263 family protein [Candidatus Alcyoniella australis]|nr:DUF6263 family protein [Candidatus Alcyoniella australis]
MKRALLCIAAALALASLFGCGFKPSLDLEQGSEYLVEQTSEQHVNQAMGGRPQNVDSTISLSYLFSVEQIRPDKDAVVKVLYQRVQVQQVGAAGSLTYDSDNSNGLVDPQMAAYATLAGHSFSMVLQPGGEVAEVFGMEQLIADMARKMSLPPEVDRLRVEQALARQYGGQAMRESLNPLMQIYPQGAIEPGDSWSRTFDVGGNTPMKIHNTWTLVQRSNGVSQIELSSQITPDTSEVELPMSGARLSYELEGTQGGSLQMQESSGLVIYSQLSQQISGTVTLRGRPGEPDSLQWPIEINGTQSLRMSKR